MPSGADQLVLRVKDRGREREREVPKKDEICWASLTQRSLNVAPPGKTGLCPLLKNLQNSPKTTRQVWRERNSLLPSLVQTKKQLPNMMQKKNCSRSWCDHMQMISRFTRYRTRTAQGLPPEPVAIQVPTAPHLVTERSGSSEIGPPELYGKVRVKVCRFHGS